MLRRTIVQFLSAAPPSLSAIESAIARLQEHPNSIDEVCAALNDAGAAMEVAQEGMQLLTALDCSETDSAAIAQGVGLNAVLNVMSHHGGANDSGRNGLPVREQCCRAIANMCMLSAPPTASEDTQQQHKTGFADLLVDGNAVELVLQVIADQVSALADRDATAVLVGQRRAAMALVNLVVFSQNGAQKAVDANAEATLSRLVTAVVDDASAACTAEAASEDPVSAAEQFAGYAAALDSALACLVRFSAMEAPDNAAGVQYRYQLLESNTLQAVLRAVVLCSSPWNPSRLDKIGKAAPSSPIAEAALISEAAALPVLHKCWTYLRTAAAHAPNHPLIFDELFAAGFASRLPYRDGSAVWTAPIKIGQCNAVMQPTQEDNIGADGSVAGRLHDAFIDFVIDVTAARKDVKQSSVESTTTDVSAILPTEAAEAVVDVLQDGVVSAYSLTVLKDCARYWGDIASSPSSSSPSSSSSESQIRRRRGDVAQRHIALLGNFCETDNVAASKDTFAIVESLLTSYIAIAASQPAAVSVDLLPVVARAFSLIWNSLNTNEGRDAIGILGISNVVRTIVKDAEAKVTVLSSTSAPAAATSNGTTTETSGEESGAPKSDTATVLAQKTLELGQKLVEKLDAVLDKPKYVQNKHGMEP